MEITAANIESALGTAAEASDPRSVVGRWKPGLTGRTTPPCGCGVYLTDEEVDFETRSRLRDMVRDHVRRETESSMLVYVRFRGASEAA